jgi:predicted transposase YbfD/YdcC
LGALPVSRHETIEKDPGRIEIRQAVWVSRLDWMDRAIRQHWPKRSSVGLIKRSREIRGKTSTEWSYYIGSKGIAGAEAFARAARAHWSIENRLH